MFLGLTNSLAMFQTIINEILRKFINTRKVMSFIDNVVVGIETKKGYDEIVEEIVKRLVGNSLYIKPKKCK